MPMTHDPLPPFPTVPTEYEGIRPGDSVTLTGGILAEVKALHPDRHAIAVKAGNIYSIVSVEKVLSVTRHQE